MDEAAAAAAAEEEEEEEEEEDLTMAEVLIAPRTVIERRGIHPGIPAHTKQDSQARGEWQCTKLNRQRERQRERERERESVCVCVCVIVVRHTHSDQ